MRQCNGRTDRLERHRKCPSQTPFFSERPSALSDRTMAIERVRGRGNRRGKLRWKRGYCIIAGACNLLLSCGQHVLEFRVLGEFEVVRDGATVTLPPSRKTRALLAYLALSRQEHRREKLCEIFWDVPDDPRGALRWSLSKIRPLVDDPAHPRLDCRPQQRRTAYRGARDRLAVCASLRRRRRRGDIRLGAGRLFLSARRCWPISTCRQTVNSTAGC